MFFIRRIDKFWFKDIAKFSSGVIGTFWSQKIRQKRMTKILNNIKSSSIFFCTKMSRYSLSYKYFLQEKSTHFSLGVLANFGLEISGHPALYHVFMHNALCQNV